MSIHAPPARASRPLELAIRCAASRSIPGQRLELAPGVLAAFQRRAVALRAALAPATPVEATELVAALDLAGIPAFALAAAARDLATLAAGDVDQAPMIGDLARRARNHAVPFRAELTRLERILAAASLPPSPPLPSLERRRELAAALRRRIGLPGRSAV